ncbi:acetylxylan esterase [Amnibacterium flavum]|uniref:Acetylesterase n=1 Tax=Amnibacterium flavum TaxID=2173173 RepID=A0A2V1HXD8_9MICO|nr:acetylxylan esterase [Amnibacterium flavum]PVZ95979.1 acetylesterase [Amnibacterium flavum]
MFTDLPEDELRRYRSPQTAPDDFDEFWARTLTESQDRWFAPRVVPVETGLTAIEVFDVTFAGFGGQEIKAWLRVPAGSTGPLPAVVEYIGYGGGRGRAIESLTWAAAGYAHLQMDSRGQGSTWSVGDTPDDSASSPQIPGFLTRGISSPDSFYYRRLMTDAVLAVDAARALEQVDGSRVAVLGGSQGGGLALAAAALQTDLRVAVAYVPFLCDFPRATVITNANPYHEVVSYLATHRDHVDLVYRTLSYFDGVNFAARSKTPVRMSAALMDEICPPSTVFAAFNAYAGEKEITVWPYNGHEGGGIDSAAETLAVFKELLG